MSRFLRKGAAYWLVLIGFVSGATRTALPQDANSPANNDRPSLQMTEIFNTLPDRPSIGEPASAPVRPASAAASIARPAEAPATFDTKFLLVTSYSFTATVLDIESTRHAIDHCGMEEKNPLLGSDPSRAKLYGIGIPITVGSTAFSYWIKKKYPNSKMWMVLPLSVSGARTVGYINNFAKCGP